MPTLNLVLVEPQIPQNTGNIARTCAVTGARLHLVKPMGFTVTDKHLKRAGLDYWHLLDLHYHENLDAFLQAADGPCYFFTTKGKQRYCDPVFEDNCYLIFGREDAGLPEALLAKHPQQCLRLPMLGNARSLNLSNTVAVAAFEALRQWDFPQLETAGQLRDFNWEE
ncbi:tRNA (cytidine(34)-2'-O)-methyltransferase [Oscillospiraceae bacterium MB08-C2-2]|nr:tRNA (cytidine(34)-2'-O)-methyltransferase [Oscillospiraceae bacterium MB08-C2-2]